MPLSAQRCDALFNPDFAAGLFLYQTQAYLGYQWRLCDIITDPFDFLEESNIDHARVDFIVVYAALLRLTKYRVFRDTVPEEVKQGALSMFEDMIYYHYNTVIRPELIRPEWEEFNTLMHSSEWKSLKSKNGRWARSKWFPVDEGNIRVSLGSAVETTEEECYSYLMSMRQKNEIFTRWYINYIPGPRSVERYGTILSVELHKLSRGMKLVSIHVYEKKKYSFP